MYGSEVIKRSFGLVRYFLVRYFIISILLFVSFLYSLTDVSPAKLAIPYFVVFFVMIGFFLQTPLSFFKSSNHRSFKWDKVFVVKEFFLSVLIVSYLSGVFFLKYLEINMSESTLIFLEHLSSKYFLSLLLLVIVSLFFVTDNGPFPYSHTFPTKYALLVLFFFGLTALYLIGDDGSASLVDAYLPKILFSILTLSLGFFLVLQKK